METKSLKLKMILTSFALLIVICGSNIAFAQKYGGSAYATVRNSEGKTRVINVTKDCIYSTVSSAKEALLDRIDHERNLHEEIVSSISYDIENYLDSGKQYGGSASVKVRDEEGKTRIINVTKDCIYSTVSSAKEALLNRIDHERNLHEETVSPINYSIDSCDK